jgi:hypothetical protein
VRLRGLYLGALTNGDTWHFFDFGVSLQPRSSVSLTALVTCLVGATTPAQAEAALATDPALSNALVVAQDMLEADKWTAVDSYLTELNDGTKFHSAALNTAEERVGLVTQIKERLGLLRDTIVAQFAVLDHDLAAYKSLRAQVSATDTRSYAEVLTEALELLATTIADADRRQTFIAFVRDLVTEFEQTGDADWFYATSVRANHLWFPSMSSSGASFPCFAQRSRVALLTPNCAIVSPNVSRSHRHWTSAAFLKR